MPFQRTTSFLLREYDGSDDDDVIEDDDKNGDENNHDGR